MLTMSYKLTNPPPLSLTVMKYDSRRKLITTFLLILYRERNGPFLRL